MTKELRQKKLPKTRTSITHEFTISGIKTFITVGMYADGKPGEIFISIAKEGSTLGGLFNAISIITSMALQHGVSIDKLAAKLSYMSFPPQGFTGEEFGYASSIVDYIFRWMAKQYGTKEVKEEKRLEDTLNEDKIKQIAEKLKEIPVDKSPGITIPPLASNTMFRTEKDVKDAAKISDAYSDSPPCTTCGGLTKRSGSCYVCMNCGDTSGCS